MENSFIVNGSFCEKLFHNYLKYPFCTAPRSWLNKITLESQIWTHVLLFLWVFLQVVGSSLSEAPSPSSYRGTLHIWLWNVTRTSIFCYQGQDKKPQQDTNRPSGGSYIPLRCEPTTLLFILVTIRSKNKPLESYKRYLKKVGAVWVLYYWTELCKASTEWPIRSLQC